MDKIDKEKVWGILWMMRGLGIITHDEWLRIIAWDEVLEIRRRMDGSDR